MAVAMRLARQGYYGGDPRAVLRAPVDIVMGLVQYETFVAEYEQTAYDLNSA